MKTFVGLRAKTYSYLRYNNDEDKNVKDTKTCVIKKIKFQDNKNYSEAAQLENKIKNLEKNETDVDNLKDFIKNNKLILKTQQNLKSERHNVFT